VGNLLFLTRRKQIPRAAKTKSRNRHTHSRRREE
jgi:hypothetical protein